MPSTLVTGPRVKLAELGGDGSENDFEAAFSQIAHAYLQNRAPGLLDYEVGFQLVERDDDDNKAFGVFGFKVGRQWIFAPVFYIRGKLKGNELLYLKNQDQFVPLKENWIDYLTAKSPIELGDTVRKDTSRIGVSPPDMGILTQSPRKYASARGTKVAWADGEKRAMAAEAEALPVARLAAAAPAFEAWPAWAKVACACLARAGVGELPHGLLLPEFLAMGLDKLAAWQRTLDAYPTLRKPFDEIYPTEAIEKAARRACCRRPSRRKANARRARVRSRKRASAGPIDLLGHPSETKVAAYALRSLGDRVPAWLDDEDRATLLRDGILIKDARDESEVSHAYAVPTRLDIDRRLFTTTETGLYDVLGRDAEPVKCLVVHGPVGPDGRQNYVTVVRVEGGGRKKSWLSTHPTRVWATKRYEPDEEREFLESLPEADSLESGSLVMLISPAMTGTFPFEVAGAYGKQDGSQVHEVHFRDSVSRDTPAFGPKPPSSSFDSRANAHDYDRWADGQRVHLGMPAGSRLDCTRGDVYVPEGSRKLVLDPPRKDRDGDFSDPEPDPPPIDLGSAVDVELRLRRSAKTLSIAKAAGSSRYVMEGIELDPIQALLHLVKGHGLAEKAARAVLEGADEAGLHGRVHEVLLKHAEPYPRAYSPYLTDDQPTSPSFPEPQYGNESIMGRNQLTQFLQEDLLPVQSVATDPANRQYYDPNDTAPYASPPAPDPEAARSAQEAYERGQTDVFDTSAIGGLLRTMGEDDLIDDDLDVITKGMDRVGRQLFKSYWHKDRYTERYGDDDMKELEDSLKNVFEAMGDLVVFMKNKTIEAMPDQAERSNDLGDLASQ